MNISKNNLTGILAGAIIVVLFWLTSSYFGNSYKITNLDSSGTDIIAFGDSLVQGVGSTSEGNFVSLLSAKIGEPIINLGHSGDTTARGLARLDAVFEHNPKLVIVLFGGNDFLHKVPIDILFVNLAQIVDAIQARGASVLLLGIRGGLLSDSYAARFKDFARRHNTGFVPNVLEGLLGDPKYMYDQVHPNNLGYAKIADKIEPVLKKMLGPN